MQYTILINQKFAIKHDLSIRLAVVYSFLQNLQNWADPIEIAGVNYWHAARSKAIKELPILGEHSRTIDRAYKELVSRQLIKFTKKDGLDYVRLNPKHAFNWSSDSDESLDPNKKGNPDITGAFGVSLSKKMREATEKHYPHYVWDESQHHGLRGVTKSITEIIKRERKQSTGIASKPSDDDVIAFWEVIMTNMDKFYKDNFQVSTINKNFNHVFNGISNGGKRNNKDAKFDPSFKDRY